MSGKYSFFSKNILLFTISGVIPKVLAFIIIPIYTSYLSTEDYGIADLIHTTVDLLMPIFALRIHDAVLRFAMDKQKNPKEVFSCGLLITWIGILIVGIATTIIAQFNFVEKQYLIIFFLTFFVLANNHVVVRFCRAINKVGVITVAGIANSVVMFTANLLFLMVFKFGIYGYLYASILGSATCLLICIFGGKVYKYLTFSHNNALFKLLITYSFPLIFSALAWWVNNASDRYILAWLCGVSIGGIYAVAYKIPSLLAAVQDIFMQAWSISAIKEFDKEDTDGFVGNIYTILQCVMAMAASLLMCLNLPIAKIIYAKDFFIAWKYVPPLLFALYFNALSLFLDGLFMAANGTKYIAVFSGVGAIVNTILNFALIYLFGAYGAALATFIGFGCGFLLKAKYIKKYISIKYDKVKFGWVALILLLQMIISFLGWMGIILHILAFVSILCLYKQQIKQAYHWIKNRKKTPAKISNEE